jgi:hypothetical protein
MNTDFKQDQKVSYDYGIIKGTGKVVGIASNGVPLVGKTYIIEPDVAFNNEVYPYTHFVCPELYLTTIN